MSPEKQFAYARTREAMGCAVGGLIDLVKAGGPVIVVGMIAWAGAYSVDRAGIDSGTDILPQPTQGYDTGTLIATPAPVFATRIAPEVLPISTESNETDVCADASDEIGSVATFIDQAGNRVTGVISPGAADKTYVQDARGLVLYCNTAVHMR